MTHNTPGICRYFRHSSSSLPILQQPICSIPLGTWVPRIGESSSKPLATLRPHASLGSALSLLVQGKSVFAPVFINTLVTFQSDLNLLHRSLSYLVAEHAVFFDLSYQSCVYRNIINSNQ